jgi:hypothetical protein
MDLAPVCSSFPALVLERECHFQPGGQRLARLDVDVLLDNAGHPQVPQTVGSLLDGSRSRLLSRPVAGSPNSMTLYTLSADTPVFAHTASENTSQLTAFPPLLLLYSRYCPRRQTALLFSFYCWVGVVYG